MNKEINIRVCPVENAGSLDNSVRRMLQNPKKILKPYINDGMKVLDIGCGPGFFTVEIAKMIGDTGKVFAVDFQQGMLEKVNKKINGTKLEQRVEIHKCENDSIGLNENVDFVLAFYMMHEVPNQDKLFNELKSILKPEGKLFIIEPKFHVSKKMFVEMIVRLKNIGFDIIDQPKVFFSRAVLASIKK